MRSIPIVAALYALAHWYSLGIADLVKYFSQLAVVPVTWNGVGVALLTLSIVAFVVWLARLAIRRMRLDKASGENFDIVWGDASNVALARFTPTKLALMKLTDGQQVVATTNSGRHTVVTVSRRRASKYFTDKNCELSQTALDRLGIELPADDNGESLPPTVYLKLTTRPLYTLGGLADATIINSDTATALTWRVFLLSFITSVIVSEFYYERSIVHESREQAKVAVTTHNH